MKVTRTSYRITTVHPTGYRDGEHVVEVSTRKNFSTNRLEKNVSGGGFGCSRDYSTPSDTVAIQNLLAENGMRMIKMVKIS
jgi:hypothetical protein